MTEQNTDREALGDIIDDWLTDPDHIDTGFLADAILNSDWLAEHDERVRREAAAEQREKDMALIRWLAKGRRRYQREPDAQITSFSIDYPIYLQAKSVEQVADMIEGTNDARGWLHSADWDAWTAIREQGSEHE